MYADLSFDYYYSVDYGDDRIRVVADSDSSRLVGRYGDIAINFQSDPDISTKVQIIPDEEITLPTNDTLTLYLEFDVLINGEENTSNNTPLVVNGRKDTIVFTTSGYEEVELNQRNIKNSYPFAGMNHFYPNETQCGFINLKKINQAIQIASQRLVAVWTEKETGNSKATRVNYKDSICGFNYSGSKSIVFEIPELNLDKEYDLVLIAVPDSIVENLSFADQSETLNILEEATGIIFGVAPDKLDMPDPVWSISFTTSKYATFKDKMDAWFGNTSSLTLPVNSETKSFTHTFMTNEGLDIFEYNYDFEDSVYTHGNYAQKVITDENLEGLVDVFLDYTKVYALNGDSVISNGINHPALADGQILDHILVADTHENTTSNGNDIPCISGSSYDSTNTQKSYLSDEELWNDIFNEVAGYLAKPRGLPRIYKFGLTLVGVNKRSQVDYCIQFSSKDGFYPPFGNTNINDTTSSTNDDPQEITLHIGYYQAIEDAFNLAMDNATAFKNQKDNCENNYNGGLHSPGGSKDGPEAIRLNVPGGSGAFTICDSEDGEFITLIEDLSCLKEKISSGDEIHNRYYSSISNLINRSQLVVPLVLTYKLPNGDATTIYPKNITIYKQ